MARMVEMEGGGEVVMGMMMIIPEDHHLRILPTVNMELLGVLLSKGILRKHGDLDSGVVWELAVQLAVQLVMQQDMEEDMEEARDRTRDRTVRTQVQVRVPILQLPTRAQASDRLLDDEGVFHGGYKINESNNCSLSTLHKWIIFSGRVIDYLTYNWLPS